MGGTLYKAILWNNNLPKGKKMFGNSFNISDFFQVVTLLDVNGKHVLPSGIISMKSKEGGNDFI